MHATITKTVNQHCKTSLKVYDPFQYVNVHFTQVGISITKFVDWAPGTFNPLSTHQFHFFFHNYTVKLFICTT